MSTAVRVPSSPSPWRVRLGSLARRTDPRRSRHLALALAGASTLVVVLGGWRGSDYPAQLFRLQLAQRFGLVWWNSQWYGGHSTAGYSLLFPLIAAAIGIGAVAVIASAAAAWCFSDLARRRPGPAQLAGTAWFAVGTASNILVGRLPFALGSAVALAAFAALDRRMTVTSILLAALSSLISPVAAAFLALAVVTRMATDATRRRLGTAVVVASLVPLVVIGEVFPDGGTMPFHWGDLTWNLAVCGVFVALIPAEHRSLRWGAVLAAGANVVLFLVPSPMGMNVGRYEQYLAGPLLVMCVVGRRRRWWALVLPPLLAWQWLPGADAVLGARNDPSTSAGYYAGLIESLRAEPGPTGRVEIPFTRQHWETYYVADALPLARGWERQLDVAYDDLFYDGSLSASTYHQWLLDNRFRWVALPDVPFDSSAEDEAALVAGGLPYLRLTSIGTHWKVWEVTDARPVVIGPARLVSLGPTGVRLDVLGPGPIDVGVRYTSRWSATGGGCAESDGGGWTRLLGAAVGPMTLSQSLAGEPVPLRGEVHRAVGDDVGTSGMPQVK